jgi:DNA-binding beta-propeller fold protein YncE
LLLSRFIWIFLQGGNGEGTNPYQLNNPAGLYLDESKQVFYISNENSHSITQWVIGDYEARNIYAGIPGRPGNSSAQLFYPQGVTMDSFGNLYVADTSNHRIQMFCPDAVFGTTVAGTGQLGNENDQLHFPYDVILDSQLNLYVADTWNSRIQKFERIH